MNQSTTTTGTKIKVKIVLLGDQNVGKSSIIEKYINDRFDPNCSPTVGIDFLAKNVHHKGRGYRLQLWDTAGQQRFRSLIPSYLKDAMSAIIVYDVTNKRSLTNAERWMRMFNQNKVNDGYSILVGNKVDLPYRTVTTQQGRAVAQSLKIGYAELSAKTGDKVEDAFLHLLDMLVMGKTNGAPTTTASETVMRQSVVTEVVERQPPKESFVTKPTPMSQVRQASSLPSLPKEQQPVDPIDQTNQPFTKEHDTIVKYPQPHMIYPPVVQNRQFEPYPQKKVDIPLHYNHPQHITIPPSLPYNSYPTLPLTEHMIANPARLPPPNIILSSRVHVPQQPQIKPKRKCCTSA